MSIQSNLEHIKAELPENVTLVAVSKTKSVSDILTAYQAGQRIFGENKIQEMTEKWQQLPRDIEWHMIGHVQSNKVKYMIPYVKMIHGVDSLKLLLEINRQAKRWRKTIDCLLQINISEEDQKFGLDDAGLNELLAYEDFKNLSNVKIIGLMGMASFTENQEQLQKEFTHLKSIFDTLSAENPQFTVLSMGMSGDYQTAIACGSTMVRIGSSIFGGR